MKKIYCIGIWWIWVSALARYYLSEWYTVYWSDQSDSPLLESLRNEGCIIHIWVSSDILDTSFEYIIYSEAIAENHLERQKARELGIVEMSYPQALSEISKNKNLISISGTHWKSTTTSMVASIFKNWGENMLVVVWTLVPQFWGKNFFRQDIRDTVSPFFVLESCEYKESFLNYSPYIAVITNIDPDHLDYYKNTENYLNAFKKFISNIRPWGYLIINREDSLSKDLDIQRKDIHIVEAYNDFFILDREKNTYPEIKLQIPWNHILFDAKLGYIVWKICKIEDALILESLESYNWVWRRMEMIWETRGKNILMSDYGHHPTEVSLTTSALKEKYPSKKLVCIFQPHQFSRTIELFEDFKRCFDACDILVVPNIYASRDSDEDTKKMSSAIFVDWIIHKSKVHTGSLQSAIEWIQNYDSRYPASSIILLQWAWNIDDLRYKIKTS